MSAALFLTTERLELWHQTQADLAELHALTAGEAMRRFLPPGEDGQRDSFQRLLRNAGSWALYGYGPLNLRLRGKPAIVGACGLFHSWRGFGKGMDDVPEAGWSIGHEHWGRGFASEAMAAILGWFDRTHGLCRVTCMIDEANARSQALACKLGFAKYGSHQDESGTKVLLYERLG